MQPKEYGDTWGISLGIWGRVKEIGSEHPSELLNIKWQKKKERENQIFQAETSSSNIFNCYILGWLGGWAVPLLCIWKQPRSV